MKKFKEYLNEEWYQSYKIPMMKEPLEIFINPTLKELNRLALSDYGVFRSFLMDDGTMYAWSKAIHSQAFNALKLNKNFIPIEVGFFGKQSDLTVTDFINNSNWNNKRSKVAEQIRKHKRFNRTIGSMNLEIGYYNERLQGDWEQ